jgi:hypothetical protein
MNDEQDLAALSPFWPRVGAALTALGGLCAVLGSLQTWTTVDIDSAMAVVPVASAILGVASIAVARLVSARTWAVITALALSGLLVLLTGIFCVFALSSGFIAVFVILAPPMCLGATVVDAASIGACERAERARARLSSQGLDLGI